jgi:hypothetical protein
MEHSSLLAQFQVTQIQTKAILENKGIKRDNIVFEKVGAVIFLEGVKA